MASDFFKSLEVAAYIERYSARDEEPSGLQMNFLSKLRKKIGVDEDTFGVLLLLILLNGARRGIEYPELPFDRRDASLSILWLKNASKKQQDKAVSFAREFQKTIMKMLEIEDELERLGKMSDEEFDELLDEMKQRVERDGTQEVEG